MKNTPETNVWPTRRSGTGKVIPDDVAKRGAELAEKTIRMDREMTSYISQIADLKSSGRKFVVINGKRCRVGEVLVPLIAKRNEATTAWSQSRAEEETFLATSGAKDNGIRSCVALWEAHNGRAWPNYLVWSSEPACIHTTVSKES